MEQWEGVAEFVAVAEQSSFTLAAQKLSTPVAQVSRKISKLEQRFSVKLLLRTTRKVTLTDAGKVYYQPVEGRMTCDSGRVLINTALNGIGIVQLPDYYVHQHMATEKLVELLTDFRDTKEGIWVLYPNNRYLSSKVRLLIDFLAERLSIYSN
jgi:DNA-binding transcriptional LysR family regulator